MKRIVFLLFALLFCLALLTACGSNDGNKKPTSEKNMMFVVQDGNAMVQIVRSDKLSTNATETQCAVNMMTTIREMTGVKLSVVTDYSGEGGTPEVDYEILVGKTARPESQTAIEQMGNRDFAHAKLSIQDSINQNVLPEVHEFMREFVPSFSLSPDELSRL